MIGDFVQQDLQWFVQFVLDIPALRLGITCLKTIDENFPFIFDKWMEQNNPVRIDYSQTIPQALEYLFSLNEKIRLNGEDPELMVK